MKKTYISPILTIVSSKTEEDLLQASGVFGPDQGIDYGGVDNDGTMDPASKENTFSVWDE